MARKNRKNSKTTFVGKSEIDAQLKTFKKLYVVIHRCKKVDNIARGLKCVDVGTQTVNFFCFQLFYPELNA